MRRTTIKGLALVGVLALSVTACSSSKAKPGTTAAASKTLVIEDKPVASFTNDFNPFDGNSIGGNENTNSLFYEPLFQFNTLDSAAAPIPWLGKSFSWSPDNKTLTITLQSGVKWSDGQPFTSADVAFTFGLMKSDPATNTGGSPVPDSVDTPDATTAVLHFSSPQAANFEGIGLAYIVPQHIWSTLGKTPDKTVVPGASVVGTGPYLFDSFSPQDVKLKANPNYWQGAPKVKEISLPAYATNDAATLALASGQIDLTGNDINDVLNTFVSKDPANNHLYQSTAPYFPAGNTVALLMNTKSTTAPYLGDVAVRKAISAAIDRQSMATQCETNYELPATSSGGLTLPIDQKSLASGQTNDLKPSPDLTTASSLLTQDGWAKDAAGKWEKNGQTIKFTIIDPSSFTDYWCDAEAMKSELNSAGFDVSDNGQFDYNSWNSAITTGNYQVALHWGQGSTAFQRLQFILDSTLSAPTGKTAAGDFSQYQSAAADSAISAYESATSPADEQTALNTLQGIMSSDVPAVPVLYGAAWYEYSTANFTGWPSSSNPDMNPSPNSQAYEYLILNLKPVS